MLIFNIIWCSVWMIIEIAILAFYARDLKKAVKEKTFIKKQLSWLILHVILFTAWVILLLSHILTGK